MSTLSDKKAVVLNYGLMLISLQSDIQEKADFMVRFFRSSPELTNDPDLLRIGQAFGAFLQAFKNLDSVVDAVAKKGE